MGNEDKMAWLTPHAAVARNGGRAACAWNHLEETTYRLSFNADGKDLNAFARSSEHLSEHLSEICDVVVRLLAVSVVHSLRLTIWSSHEGAFMNAPTLAYLMEQCQSLKYLILENLKMDENHCHVVGTYSRPDLEIVLVRCTITSAGASTLAEVLGRNQGPTKLAWCKIDNLVLAHGLRGNSRLKSLNLRHSDSSDDGNRQVLAIADALQQNVGLVEFNLSFYGFRVINSVERRLRLSQSTSDT
jgi:hypothetical protein